MCGIIGLLLKDRSQEASLGQMITPMFDCMAERGPDSAGLAAYGERAADELRRYSLFAPRRDYAWTELANQLARRTERDVSTSAHGNHAVLTTAAAPDLVQDFLSSCHDEVRLLSVGRRIVVYKDMGDPSEIAQRYDFEHLSGTHCVGHTRMATESAVSPAHAHPFTAGEDFCLVHNGSLSNPYMLRRKLEARGHKFETDNDSEAACRYFQWRMSQGETLDEAIRAGFHDLDGFYTFLIATENQLTLVRDAFACKPAVVAETPAYVAVSSEFRSLAHLPGIADARIFEPTPMEIYSWRA